jgi:DinB superfamily
MPPERRPAERILRTLDAAWAGLQESYCGLPDAALLEPGVAGDWSVKDVLAHVNTWQEEALAHLPVIAAGGTPPRYATTFGGIDAFNARTAERKRDMSLSDVRRRLDETHRRLVDLIRSVPEDQLTRETRFRRRLRLDTYGHYRLHARGIRAWRARTVRASGGV